MMIGNTSNIAAKRALAQQVLRRRGAALGMNENAGYGGIMAWVDHAGWHNPSGWENGTGDGVTPEHPDGRAAAGRLLHRRLDLS